MNETPNPAAADHDENGTARTEAAQQQAHGIDFVDDYEWLRDKESRDTLDYLEAENAYTDEQTDHLSDLRENIYNEIKSRIKETDMSVPVRNGRYWYFGRTEEGKSYGIYCRIPVGDEPWMAPEIPAEPTPEEEVFLNANELAEGHEFFSLGTATVTT